MNESKKIDTTTITDALRKVFGHENVEPADNSRGYFEVFFSKKEQADAVMNLLRAQGFEDSLAQSLGGFTDTLRPNMWLVLGNDTQRVKNTDLHNAASQILGFIEQNEELLKTAAGIAGRAKGA